MMTIALAYASRGWSVIPLHAPVFPAAPSDLVQCSCRSRACNSIGKHPRTPRGLTDASREPDTIRGWWTRWPTANIGIITGKASGGLVVLDIDNGNGRAGDDSLRDLLSSVNEELPETPVSLTGNGMHVLLVSPTPIQNSADVIGRGLDIRGEGGYIVAPPSVHKSGRRYEWEGSSHPDDIPIAMLPLWLGELTSGKRRPKSGSAGAKYTGDPVVEGGRNETLFRLGCKLRRSGIGEEAILAALEAENHRVCVPALDTKEVERIAKSASGYEADDPYYSAHASVAPSPVARREPGDESEPDDGPAVSDASLSPTDPDWTQKLMRKPPNKQGVQVPIADQANAVLILTHDPEWRGVIVYDAFRREERTMRPPPWLDEDRPSGAPAPGLWTDEDSIRLRNWLARTYDLRLPTSAIVEAVKVVAQRNAVNPVREYLETVIWSGNKLLDVWISRYLGAEPTPYAACVGRWWLISAVARVFEPGCQADHVLILEGDQGAGKSSALRALVPTREWFSDTPFDLGDKEAYMAIRGRWIVELAELDSLSRSDAARSKAFFTGSVDTYRQPYGRTVIQVPRQCVFAGTVNPDSTGYLVDPTGARRFWPVECKLIDLEGLELVRDQLWAEAVAAYRAGESYHPPPEARPMFKAEQLKRFKSDVWEVEIAKWVVGEEAKRIEGVSGYLTTGSILANALGVEPSRWTSKEQMRVGAAMASLGWRRARKRVAGALAYVYERPLDTPESDAA